MNFHMKRYINILIQKPNIIMIIMVFLSSCSIMEKKEISSYEKETLHKERVASCVNSCLNQYKVVQSSCNYLVAVDKNTARKHRQYGLCLQRKGFHSGEKTCGKECVKNDMFFIK